MISSSTRESGVRDGVLTGPRVPAARLRRDDLITGDPLALAGDLQRAWRLVRAPRGAWIVAEPVTRDVGTRRGEGLHGRVDVAGLVVEDDDAGAGGA